MATAYTSASITRLDANGSTSPRAAYSQPLRPSSARLSASIASTWCPPRSRASSSAMASSVTSSCATSKPSDQSGCTGKRPSSSPDSRLACTSTPG